MSWSVVAGRSLWRAVAISALLTGSARAEDASIDEILNAMTLRPRILSVGPQNLTVTARPTLDSAYLDGLRGRPSHAVSAQDRDQIADMTVSMPHFDLTAAFNRGSAVLRSAALTNARRLGRALASERLRGRTFLIAGHTDAKGSETVNQVLSERRAEVVKRYLVATFGVPARDLITVGYGKSHLQTPYNPLGRENRRVQVINMLAVQTTER